MVLNTITLTPIFILLQSNWIFVKQTNKLNGEENVNIAIAFKILYSSTLNKFIYIFRMSDRPPTVNSRMESARSQSRKLLVQTPSFTV